jgi:hypothetical protein
MGSAAVQVVFDLGNPDLRTVSRSIQTLTTHREYIRLVTHLSAKVLELFESVLLI